MQLPAEALGEQRQMVSQNTATNNTDATAETLARTTADGQKNTAISNNTDAITAAETLARTTADGLQNTAISNTDAITTEVQLEQMHNKAEALNDCNFSRNFEEQQQMVSQTQLFQ
jgi:hypothetical protein